MYDLYILMFLSKVICVLLGSNVHNACLTFLRSYLFGAIEHGCYISIPENKLAMSKHSFHVSSRLSNL